MKRSFELRETACPLCGARSEQEQVELYPATFSEEHIAAHTFSARRNPDKVHYRMVRCLQDGMVRSNPVLESKILNKLYAKSTVEYGSEEKNLISSYLPQLESVISRLPKSAKMVEVGCGSGFMLQALKEQNYPFVFGVEPSKSARNMAGEHIQKSIINQPLNDKLFKRKSLDFIFFFQTLDHVPEPNTFLRSCYNALKPGGFIFSLHHNLIALPARLLGEKSPIVDIEHTHLYTPATSKLLFERNGFMVKKVWTPKNKISMQHLLKLLPLPNELKSRMSKAAIVSRVLAQSLWLDLGNICIVGQKK